MTPEITIVVPSRKAKYNYEQLEMLLKMRNIMAATVLPQEVRGTNNELFISIGEGTELSGCASQFVDFGVSIGFYQSHVWIDGNSFGGGINKEYIDTFKKTYASLIEDLDGRLTSMTDEYIENKKSFFWKAIYNKFNPVIWYSSIIITKKDRGFFKKFLVNVKNLSSIRIISEEYMYRFGVVKFVHDYLDGFMKENGFIEENGEWIRISSDKE